VRRAAPLVALVLALTACSGVPDDGGPVSVRTVPPVRAVQEEPDVRVQPPGPVPGAAPVQVVRAFLGAAVSSDGGHAVARSYLTREAHRGWPDAGPVRVFRLRDVVRTGVDAVRVLGTMVGLVGLDGTFTPTPGPVDLTIRLRRSGPSWQLATPPPGVYLQDVYFTQVYVPYRAYFVAAGTRRLVPDLRYLDRSLGNAEPSELVRLLLGGPSSWLSPGVRTAFPPGTRLRGNVASDDDVLVVDLTAEAEFASAGDRALLSAQLVWTLRQFPVSGVRIEVEGRRFEAPGAGRVQGVGLWSSLNPASPVAALPAYHLGRGAVRVLVPGERSGVPVGAPFGGREARSGVLSAAVTLEGAALALVKPGPRGRQRLLVGPSEGPLAVRYGASSLSRPTWGPRSHAVLVVADGRELVLVPQKGPVVTVSADALEPWLSAGERIRAVRFAPDGVRLALVVGSGASSVLLAGILRGEGGPAPALVEVRSVAEGLTDLVDVGWSAEDALVTVGREPGGAEAEPCELSADGSTRTDSTRSGLPAKELRHVVATPPDRVLIDVGGTTYQRFLNSWGPPGASVVAGGEPFYPG
jgi:hypothetical protein